MKKDKISVAVFGCSHWHTPLYLDCIKKHTVCGVTDPNPQIGNTFAQDLKCSYYSTPEELLKNHTPDFAFCFAPHSEMALLAQLMIKNHIAFSVEKPVSYDSMQLRQLIELNNVYNVYCSIPFIWRISSLYKTLHNEICPEDILHMSFSFIAGSPNRYRFSSPWMLQKKYAGGGCMTNLGVHFIDLALALTGSSTAEVTGSVFHYACPDIDVETHATTLLKINQSSVTIETGYSYPESETQKRINRWEIITTKGLYIVENGLLEIRKWNRPPQFVQTDTDSDSYYSLYAEQCITQAINHQDPVADLSTMLNVREILDNINKCSGGKK